MYVLDYKGQVCGYVVLRTLRIENYKYGVIDLIALAPEFRGRGLGVYMLKHALRNHLRLDSIFVGTQANNIAALNLYTKLGFKLLASEVTMHYKIK